MIKSLKFKIKNFRKGFTLIELIVSIAIFSLIMVSLASVFVSTVRAYSKARVMKDLKGNIDFAIGSIAKDVRMGRIESPFDIYDSGTKIDTVTNDGTIKDYFAVTRNISQGVVCYHIDDADGVYLGVAAGTSASTGVYASCPLDDSTNYSRIVDLTGTEMSFDTGASGTAGFYSLATDPPTTPTRRGWVEVNFNIAVTSGNEMDADLINVQTIVSSRDYGWENITP
jgi:prepilin-type N-terminal cleavage/methylation domain-containing protein